MKSEKAVLFSFPSIVVVTSREEVVPVVRASFILIAQKGGSGRGGRMPRS